MSLFKKVFLPLFCLIFIISCAEKRPSVPDSLPDAEQVFEEKEEEIKEEVKELFLLEVEDYPEFEDDLEYKGLLAVLYGSLSFYKKLPPQRAVYFGDDVYTAKHMLASTLKLISIFMEAPDKKSLNEKIRKDFLIYKAAGTPFPGSETRPYAKVLFTGYYEPVLMGSLKKSERFSVPLYGIPEDLIELDLSPFGSEYRGKKIKGRWTGKSFEPYYDWDDISYKKCLEGKAPVVLYLSSVVDKFFLQIQGSGLVYLDGGKSLRVHYRGQNGRPYRSIGTYLINTGRIPREEMSMQSIKKFLKENPSMQRQVLAQNPSYVFFHTVKDGPVGALGFTLTAQRSIAVDRRIFPDGAPVFIQSQKPLLKDREIADWQPFSRFMAAQDTGGAIRGSGRADIFFGSDAYAELAAGHMQHSGDMFFLVMKP